MRVQVHRDPQAEAVAPDDDDDGGVDQEEDAGRGATVLGVLRGGGETHAGRCRLGLPLHLRQSVLIRCSTTMYSIIQLTLYRSE